jgi:hypothetical protein
MQGFWLQSRKLRAENGDFRLVACVERIPVGVQTGEFVGKRAGGKSYRQIGVRSASEAVEIQAFYLGLSALFRSFCS